MDLFVFSPSSLRSSLFSLLVSGLIEWRTDKLSVVVNLPDFFLLIIFYTDCVHSSWISVELGNIAMICRICVVFRMVTRK